MMRKPATILGLVAALILGLSFAIALERGETDKATSEKEPKNQCPKTMIMGKAEDCLKCHTAPSFKIRETKPDEHLVYPRPNMRFTDWVDGKPTRATYLLKDIDADFVQEFFEYARLHNIRHATIEIHSPGGSLFQAWKIVGLMREWQSEKRIVATKVYGFAASAGFLVAASGSKGHRLVSPQAELMWHELLLIMFGVKISTPSSTEEENRVMRHLMDTANEWLAEVSKINKEDLDRMVKNREFWVRGKEAVEYGFADGFLCG